MPEHPKNELVCPNCGKVFLARKRSPSEVPLQFCTRECKHLWGHARADALLAAGEPLLAVADDRLTCNLCGKGLKSVGTHFTRYHGLDPISGKFRAEANLLFGLPYGARLASASIREKLRQNALSGHYAAHAKPALLNDPAVRAANALARKLCSLFPASPEQLDRLAKLRALAARANHVKWCVVLPCPICGDSYQTTRAKHQRKTCSKPGCRSAYLSRQKDRGARRSYRCATCGTAVTAYQGRSSQYCSKKCHGKALESRQGREMVKSATALKDGEVWLIRRLCRSGLLLNRQIGAMFQRKQPLISRISTGKAYWWVEE